MPKIRHLSTPVLLAIGLAFVAGCGPQPLGTGNAMPPLRVAGWTNGAPPSMDDLVGKVIVLNVFASW